MPDRHRGWRCWPAKSIINVKAVRILFPGFETRLNCDLSVLGIRVPNTFQIQVMLQIQRCEMVGIFHLLAHFRAGAHPQEILYAGSILGA